jgi:hypothetical protein
MTEMLKGTLEGIVLAILSRLRRPILPGSRVEKSAHGQKRMSPGPVSRGSHTTLPAATLRSSSSAVSGSLRTPTKAAIPRARCHSGCSSK